LHGVNSTITRAGSHGHDCPCLGCQAINAWAGGDRLTRLVIGAESGPVSFLFNRFVGNGVFDDEQGAELALCCQVKVAHKCIAGLIGQKGIVELYPRDAQNGALHDLFDTGLGCSVIATVFPSELSLAVIQST